MNDDNGLLWCSADGLSTPFSATYPLSLRAVVSWFRERRAQNQTSSPASGRSPAPTSAAMR
jgi:hypothetical protein